jgi:hypothetical protein
VPLTCDFDREAAMVRTKCAGTIGMPEVFHHFRTLSDPERPAALDMLLDLREVTAVPTADQLRATTIEIARLAPILRFRVCAIVTDTDGLFGMSRMFSVFAEQYFQAISVFRSAEQGERWLEAQRDFCRERERQIDACSCRQRSVKEDGLRRTGESVMEPMSVTFC